MPSRWETRQRRRLERQRARGCVGRDERFRQLARGEAASYLEDAAARDELRPMREAIEAYERRAELRNRRTYDYLRDLWYGPNQTTGSNLNIYTANSWHYQPTSTATVWATTNAAAQGGYYDAYYGPPSVAPIRVSRILTPFAMQQAVVGPDALIQHALEGLIQKINREAGRTVSPDEIWYRWTTEDTGIVRVEAEWAPPNTYPGQRMEEVWLRWQSMPQVKRVWSARENRYVELSPEESRRRAHQEKRQALVFRTRRHAHALRERVARRRARALLLEHLSPEQRADYMERGYFHVETAGGQRRYRIREGRAGNIDLVKDGDREAPLGGRLRRFCFHEYHPTERPPVEDNMLAQALFITAHEDEFLREANPA